MWIVWRIRVRFGIRLFGGQRVVWTREWVVKVVVAMVDRRGECPVGVSERIILEKKEAMLVNRSGRKLRGLGDETNLSCVISC
jgi:hypothetical protein